MRRYILRITMILGLTAPVSPAFAGAKVQTLHGAPAAAFATALETGGVEKDAEHAAADGTHLLLTSIDCHYTAKPELASQPLYSCNVVYSDRMSEDGLHYKTTDLDAPQAKVVYETLASLFGTVIMGPELVTNAQTVDCLTPTDGSPMLCTLTALSLGENL